MLNTSGAGGFTLSGLFQIPACAPFLGREESSLPAGGIGAGHFGWSGSGHFTDWRIEPGDTIRREIVAANAFHLWYQGGAGSRALTLAGAADGGWPAVSSISPTRRTLFPLQWRDYGEIDGPIQLECLAFSPVIPGSYRETSLPVYTVIWRARNRSDFPLEMALMLTWACGWPDLVADSAFDMQHDNLCVSAGLGSPAAAERMGIAIPDLHSEGVYLQSVEPWNLAGGASTLWHDFAADGELDPAVAQGAPLGAAAWVKFSLNPEETKEIPFVIMWHFPQYKSGVGTDQYRWYTQFLEKRRPDNAIVWLAEEAVQNWGQETANYRYWLYQIEDWQREALHDPSAPPHEAARRINSLGALLRANSVWAEDGRFSLRPGPDQCRETLEASLASAVPLSTVWPQLAAHCPGLGRRDES